MTIKIIYNNSDEFNSHFPTDYLRICNNQVIKSIYKCKCCNKVAVIIGEKTIANQYKS